MEAAEAGAEAVPFWFAVGTALEEVELPPVLLTRVFILRNRRGRGASLCVEDAGDCGLKNKVNRLYLSKHFSTLDLFWTSLYLQMIVA